jgi:hypothetical protein
MASELTHDWQSFQGAFYPRRKMSALPSGVGASVPLYVVVDGVRVVSAYGEGEDLCDWVGKTYAELAEKMDHRKLVVFDRKQVDEWMGTAAALPHYYDQSSFFREKAATLRHRHFMLEALHGWWRKLFPVSYGIYLRIEGTSGASHSDFFMVMRRGRVDSYVGLDVTDTGDRAPAETVKALSERYILRVQGFVVSQKDWAEWSDMNYPWRKVLGALRHKSLKLVPFRWGMAFLLLIRGIFGV